MDKRLYVKQLYKIKEIVDLYINFINIEGKQSGNDLSEAIDTAIDQAEKRAEIKQEEHFGNNLDVAKMIIEDNLKVGDCGLFNTSGSPGDERVLLHANNGLSIYLCPTYKYFEVFGLSVKEFRDLKNYYELILKGVDYDEEV